MGEKFLEEKSKRFKQRQEQKRAQLLESPDLLSATRDRKETLYQFYSPEENLKMISPILLVDEGRSLVSVFLGTTRVGEVDAGGSADLRELFQRFGALGKSIKAYIHSARDWSGYYTAKISHSRH